MRSSTRLQRNADSVGEQADITPAPSYTNRDAMELLLYAELYGKMAYDSTDMWDEFPVNAAEEKLCEYAIEQGLFNRTNSRWANWPAVMSLETVMHTRPRDETGNDRDTSRTVETAREWRDWPRMTAVSRDPARPGENRRIRILRVNPAYSNNWYWTSVTLMMNSTIQLQILSSYNSHLGTSRST
jgi:hypothetical protein